MVNQRLDKPLAGKGYRADIDGLRAIAVCLVMGYHIRFNHFDGGFIGVDVFFVISGYLISSILVRDIDSDRFSITGFYERRIRRIFPALMGVLTFTSVLAWRYCFPSDMVDYARSLVAAVLSVSNIYFSQKSGYFDFASVGRPLLHTWSLAVEEQFYIVFPLLLLVIHRYASRHRSQILIALTALSFAASAILVFRFPTSTFYLAPTRAWELLVGTIVSLGLVRLPNRRWAREIAGLAGLALLAAGGLFLSEATPFPGAAALVPCVGAALIILGGMNRDTLSAKLLSLPPIVFVGTISYSLYLWHWPLIVFRKYDFEETFLLNPHRTRLLILAEVFLLGFLSWKFIETPFRKGLRSSRRVLFLGAAGVSLALICSGVIAIQKGGFPQRYSPEARRVSDFYGKDEAFIRQGQCFLMEDKDKLDRAACLPQVGSSSTGKLTYVIAGSSHAAHLWLGLSTVFPAVNWQQITAANCRPTLEQPSNAPGFCLKMRDLLYKEYLPSHRVDAVVLSAIWSPSDLSALSGTLNYLSSLHIKAIVMGPIMMYDIPLPELLAINIRHGNDTALRRHLKQSQFTLDASMAEMVSHHEGALYVSLVDLLCPQHHCVTYAQPFVPFQSDQGHLTREGSIALAERLRDQGRLVPIERHPL